MRTVFPHYYKPTKDEFEHLWKDGIFSLDANVLLNVYRYSEATAKQLIKLLEKISPRIILPYQFALEFHKNRISAIGEQIKYFMEAEKALEKFINEQVSPQRKHPFLTEGAIQKFTEIQNELKESRKRHESLLRDDEYLEKLTTTIGLVSDKPSNLEDLHNESRARYASKIPPGYMDVKKGEPNSFGDCIAWLQLIEVSKKNNKPLILVCDDTKEDWWEIHDRKTIGPRIELTEEFEIKTKQKFYMYSSDQFMRYANEHLGGDISSSAIAEAKERISNLSKIADEEKIPEMDTIKISTIQDIEVKAVSNEKQEISEMNDEPQKGA